MGIKNGNKERSNPTRWFILQPFNRWKNTVVEIDYKVEVISPSYFHPIKVVTPIDRIVNPQKITSKIKCSYGYPFILINDYKLASKWNGKPIDCDNC